MLTWFRNSHNIGSHLKYGCFQNPVAGLHTSQHGSSSLRWKLNIWDKFLLLFTNLIFLLFFIHFLINFLVLFAVSMNRPATTHPIVVPLTSKGSFFKFSFKDLIFLGKSQELTFPCAVLGICSKMKLDNDRRFLRKRSYFAGRLHIRCGNFFKVIVTKHCHIVLLFF